MHPTQIGPDALLCRLTIGYNLKRRLVFTHTIIMFTLSSDSRYNFLKKTRLSKSCFWAISAKHENVTRKSEIPTFLSAKHEILTGESTVLKCKARKRDFRVPESTVLGRKLQYYDSGVRALCLCWSTAYHMKHEEQDIHSVRDRDHT